MGVDRQTLGRVAEGSPRDRRRLAELLGNVIGNVFVLEAAGTTAQNEYEVLVRSLFDRVIGDFVEMRPEEVGSSLYDEFIASMESRVFEGPESLVMRAEDRLSEILGAVGAQQASIAARDLLQLDESGFSVTLDASGLSPRFFQDVLRSNPFPKAEGKPRDVLGGWIDAHGEKTIRDTRRVIQEGMIAGDTTDEIVIKLRGRHTGRFEGIPLADGTVRRVGVFDDSGTIREPVMRNSTREARAVARTATNHIANESHLELYRQNDDIIAAVEFVATLDDRTTLICGATDGTVWGMHSDEILSPPLHYQCRSVLVPIVDWYDEGLDFSDKGTKASQFGPVKGSESYEEWLQSQDRAFVEKVLGEDRARAFLDRGLPLKKMVREDGSVITVKELREKGQIPQKRPEDVGPTRSPDGFTEPEELLKRLDSAEESYRPEYDRLNEEYENEILGPQEDVFKRLRKRANEIDDSVRPRTPSPAKLADETWNRLNEEYLELDKRGKEIMDRISENRNRLAEAKLDAYGVAPENRNRAEWSFVSEKDVTPNFREKVEEHKEIWRRIVDRRWLANWTTKIGVIDGRSYQLGGVIQMERFHRARSFLHEMGHVVEELHPSVRQSMRDFWEKRTEGEEFEFLNDVVTDGRKFKDHERTKLDKFFDAYVGKIYPDNSEVLSMGIERIWESPRSFFEADPEHFRLVWGIMQGFLPREFGMPYGPE